MLALAILGMLAVASPADTAVRVPGTTLRFGLDDTAVSARGFTADGPGTRRGRCRFFGLASDATLAFEGGRLARAEFVVSGASTYELAYVHDQLTAMGYRKNCTQPTPKTEVCDWTARSQVHVEVSGANLKASIVPARAAVTAPVTVTPAVAAPAFATPAAVAPAVVATTARDSAPATRSSPAARGLERARGASAPATALTRDTILGSVPRQAIPPPAPAGGPALSRPPRDSVRSAAPAMGAVPVSPETLAVELPGRASPYAPATLLSESRCRYPETAREAGIQGRVWVYAFVDTNGRVLRTRLKSGVPVLNAAALECVRDWSFQPVLWKGAPCRCWVLTPVTFTVH